jgi:hypothetical protein
MFFENHSSRAKLVLGFMKTIDQGYISTFTHWFQVPKGKNIPTLVKTSVKWVFEFLISIGFGYF